MTSDRDGQTSGSAAYARFLPTSALGWVTMIVRAVFELGVAFNLYGMLERIVHVIVWSSEEAAALGSYVTAISLIVIASYVAWRVFSLQWKRSDLFQYLHRLHGCQHAACLPCRRPVLDALGAPYRGCAHVGDGHAHHLP